MTLLQDVSLQLHSTPITVWRLHSDDSHSGESQVRSADAPSSSSSARSLSMPAGERPYTCRSASSAQTTHLRSRRARDKDRDEQRGGAHVVGRHLGGFEHGVQRARIHRVHNVQRRHVAQDQERDVRVATRENARQRERGLDAAQLRRRQLPLRHTRRCRSATAGVAL